MSGQTIINSLLFTDDNKHAYIYSGEKAMSSGVSQDVLNFKTESYYLMGKFCWNTNSSTTPDEILRIKFNDFTIVRSRYANAVDASNDQPIPLIIPPFTTVNVDFEIQANSEATFFFVAKVGMPPRVGN
tara:strand:- start:117 stop:503 length:387 start_codon:yes stop_codon:yes gene_type:complete